MENNSPKFLKKILATSALSLSMVVALTNTANTTLAADRTSQNNPSAFTNAGNWAPPGLIVATDNILIGGIGHAVNADIPGVFGNINAQALAAGNFTVAAGNFSFTNILNGGGGGTIPLVLSAGSLFTVTGNDLSGLDTLDFGNVNGVFNFSNTGNVNIISDVSNAALGTVNITTRITVTDAWGAGANGSLLEAGIVNIGTPAAAAVLVSQPTVAAIPITATVNLINAKSVLTLDSTNTGGAATWTLNTPITPGADGNGQVVLNAAGGNTLDVANGGAGSIGVGPNMRIGSLQIQGGSDIVQAVPIYALSINHTSNAFVTYNGLINFGVTPPGAAAGTGSYNFIANGATVFFNGPLTGNINYGNTNGATLSGPGVIITGGLGNYAAPGVQTYAPLGVHLFSKAGGQLTGIAQLQAIGFNALNPASTVLINSAGNHRFNLAAGGAAGGIVSFAAGVNINGEINTVNALAQVNALGARFGLAPGALAPVDLTFLGASTVTGAIGTVAAPVGTITSAAAPLVLQGAVSATALNISGNMSVGQLMNPAGAAVTFRADGTLELTVDADQRIGAINTGANMGTINADVLGANRTLALGVVGGGPLKMIQAANANIQIQPGNYGGITFATGNPDARLRLVAPGAYTIANLTHPAGAGILEVAPAGGGNVILGAATIVSTEANPLKGVMFSGGTALLPSTLTIPDGTNLFTVDGFSSDVDDAARIITLGNGRATGPVGVNRDFSLIEHQGAAGTVFLYTDNVKTQNDINIVNAKAGLQFAGNVTTKGHNITGAGYVEFVNPEPIIVEAGLRTGGVKISGSDVTAGSIQGGTVEFGAQPAKLVFTDRTVGDSGGAIFTTTSTERNQDISIGHDYDINGPVGTQANAFGNVNIIGDRVLTISTGEFHAGVMPETTGTGTVNVNAANVDIRDLGGPSNILKIVNLNFDSTILGNTYSALTTIADTVRGTFSGTTTGGIINLAATAANGTTAIFTDGIKLGSDVTTAFNGGGRVEFQGGSIVDGQLGTSAARLELVSFMDLTGKTQSLLKNIYANGINAATTIMSVDAPQVVFDAPAQTYTASTLRLNSNEFVLNNSDTTLVGPIKIETQVDSSTYTIGHIVLTGAGSTINSAAMPTLAIKVTHDDINLPNGTLELEILEYGADVVEKNITIDPAKITTSLPDSKGFIEWGFDPHHLTVTLKNTGAKGATALLSRLGASRELQEATASLYHPSTTGQAREVANEFANIALRNEQKFLDATTRLFETKTNISDLINTGQQAVDTLVSRRMTSMTPGDLFKGKNTNTELTEAGGSSIGMAAGDQAFARYGVWGNPFFSHSIQKKAKHTTGYKADAAGVTIGGDTMANDTMTIGGAISYIKSDVKYKGDLMGDKAKIDSYFGNLYGTQLIGDSYFVTGIISFGSSKVKTTLKRIGYKNRMITSEYATGKYDTMSWGGEFLGGYNYRPSDIVSVIPMAGFSYFQFNEAGYTEKGTRNQNRTINKKSTNKVDLIAGARFITAATEAGDLVYTPEFSAFIRQALSNKSPKTELRLNGLVAPITPKAIKSPKTVCDLGASITVQHNQIDTGLSYNFTFNDKKFRGHTGALKMRLNF